MRRGLTVRILLSLTSALALTPLTLAPALAETRQALVIAERALGQEAGQPARDALQVSRALLAAGFDVRRLENPLALPDAPVDAPDVMLLYVSGDLAIEEGRQMVKLSSGAVDLAELALRYPARGQRILLAEACPAVPVHADAPASADAAPALPAPEGDVMIARSGLTPADCADQPRLTASLLSALDEPGTELADSLSEAGLAVATGSEWQGFQARAPLARPASAAGTIIVDQPLRPVDTSAMRASSGLVTAVAQSGTGGVQILPVAAPTQPLAGDRAARPTQEGLPEPSIIVGEPARDGVADSSQSELLGTALGTGIEERRRIRAEDPQLFASLLESGAFDPPADQMAAAIQTELQRMNCYRSGIDGIWGNGSRQSVDRYFQQAGGSPVTREPEAALFRQIALRDDLRCPDPVVRQPAVRAAPAANTATRSAPARTAPVRTTQPQRQQPVAQQPVQTGPSRGLNPNALGSGIFR